MFTLPHQLAPLLALQNKEVMYGSVPLQRPDPDRDRRGSQAPRRRDRLFQRPAHLESEATASSPRSLRRGRRRPVLRSYALGAPPEMAASFYRRVLSEVFRGKFLGAPPAGSRFRTTTVLRSASRPSSARAVGGLIRQLYAPRWVVYCKPTFGGPEQVLLCYLGAYTHRVAISNRRLVSFVDDKVTSAGATPLTETRSDC